MSTARKILIVDDDEDLRESLKDQLALHDEFEVFTAGTASKGIEVAKSEHLDLVMLDVGLPDMDGREACKLLRKNGFKSPIVRLTEKETSILKYLYRAGEKVVTRDVLLQEVWGYNSGVTTHTLETHIYRLRQKIEKDPSHAELLVTETGGYKLVP